MHVYVTVNEGKITPVSMTSSLRHRYVISSSNGHIK